MRFKNTGTCSLYVSFAKLTGLAREAVSAAIQTGLFALGYHWDTKSGPSYLYGESLHIASVEWNPFSITYCDETYAKNDVLNHKIFDAATEFEKFLEAAKLARASFTAEPIFIDGIKCTISKTGISLDASTLMTHVGEQARAKQKEIFGE